MTHRLKNSIINTEKERSNLMELIKPNDKLFGLIYGMSGSGKTHLAATYCAMYPDEPVLLIDADMGSATLNAKDLKCLDKLFVIDFKLFKDLDSIYQLCEKNTVEDWCKAIPDLKGKLTKPFRCVIWDTWSEVQWILSEEIRDLKHIVGKGLSYREPLQLQHWGQMTDLNKMSAKAFKDLPMDVLFLMQAEISTDPVSQQMIKGPAIAGKLVTEFPAMFTTVIYCYTTPNGGYKATTLSKLGWPAKVRGFEGKDLDNPTLKELLDA